MNTLIESFLANSGWSDLNISDFEAGKYIVDCRRAGSRERLFVKAAPSENTFSELLETTRSDPEAAALFKEVEKVIELPLTIDRARGLAAYRLIEGSAASDMEPDLDEMAVSIGRLLADLHNVSIRYPELVQSLEVEDVHDVWPSLPAPTIREFNLGAGSDYTAILRYLASFPELFAICAEVQAADYDRVLCHADIKFDNIMIDGAGNYRLIDCDDMRLYDRHLDIGCFIAELLSSWIARIEFEDLDRIDDAISEAEPHFQQSLEWSRRFLEAYSNRVSMPHAIDLGRVAYFAGRTLAHKALGTLVSRNLLTRVEWASLHVGTSILLNRHEFGQSLEAVHA